MEKYAYIFVGGLFFLILIYAVFILIESRSIRKKLLEDKANYQKNFHEFKEYRDLVMREISRQREINEAVFKWISVDEKLPEIPYFYYSADVLIYDAKNEFVFVGRCRTYDHIQKCERIYWVTECGKERSGVTHWAEFPNPPKQ